MDGSAFPLQTTAEEERVIYTAASPGQKLAA